MTFSPLEAYIRQLNANLTAGRASERTHYRALADLIEGLAEGIVAAVELKGEEVGVPDLHVSLRGVPQG
jgi:hypothetical protein